ERNTIDSGDIGHGIGFHVYGLRDVFCGKDSFQLCICDCPCRDESTCSGVGCNGESIGIVDDRSWLEYVSNLPVRSQSASQSGGDKHPDLRAAMLIRSIGGGPGEYCSDAANRDYRTLLFE